MNIYPNNNNASVESNNLPGSNDNKSNDNNNNLFGSAVFCSLPDSNPESLNNRVNHPSIKEKTEITEDMLATLDEALSNGSKLLEGKVSLFDLNKDELKEHRNNLKICLNIYLLLGENKESFSKIKDLELFFKKDNLLFQECLKEAAETCKNICENGYLPGEYFVGDLAEHSYTLDSPAVKPKKFKIYCTSQEFDYAKDQLWQITRDITFKDGSRLSIDLEKIDPSEQFSYLGCALYEIPELGINKKAEICALLHICLVGKIHTKPADADNEERLFEIEFTDCSSDPSQKNNLAVASTTNSAIVPQSKISITPDEMLKAVVNNGKQVLTDTAIALTNTALEFTNTLISFVTKPFVDSDNEDHIGWKIRRYEALIDSVCNIIYEANDKYNSTEISKDMLSNNVDETVSFEHKFNVFYTTVKDEKKTAVYDDAKLKRLRKLYNDQFIPALREAAKWSEENSGSVTAKKIDLICYRFYVDNHLNEACKAVVDELKTKSTFVSRNNYTHPIVKQIKVQQESFKKLSSDYRGPVINQAINSLRGHIPGLLGLTTFDPNRQSNFPQHILSYKSKNGEVRDIAMGSPTIENGISEAEIAPEFLGYLRHCKANNLKHLYFSHQNFIPRPPLEGDESNRSNALLELSQSEKFKNVFEFVAFNEDSAFSRQEAKTLKSIFDTKSEITADKIKEKLRYALYNGELEKEGYKLKGLSGNQIDKDKVWNNVSALLKKTVAAKNQTKFKSDEPFLKELFVKQCLAVLETAEMFEQTEVFPLFSLDLVRFKKEVVDQLFTKELEVTGNYISPELKLKGWFEKLVEDLHEKVFIDINTKKPLANLNNEMRRAFICVAQLFLSEHIRMISGANALNDTCKDGIDRAIARKLLKYVFHLIKDDKLDNKEYRDFIDTLVFARALVVRKRAISADRLDKVLLAVDFILRRQDQMKGLYQHTFVDLQDERDLQDEMVFPGHEMVFPGHINEKIEILFEQNEA